MVLERIWRFLAKRLQIRDAVANNKFQIATTSEEADGFVDLEAQVREQYYNLTKEATSFRRQRKVMQIFDDLTDSISRVQSLAECMRRLHPDPKFVEYAEKCVATMGTISYMFYTNQSLYNALKRNLNEGDGVDRRVAELFANSFKINGIHLSYYKRITCGELSATLYQLSKEYMRRCTYQTGEEKVSLNKTSISSVFDSTSTVDYSSWWANHDSQVRQTLYRRHFAALQSQEDNLKLILDQRQKLSQICGYETYAHFALRGTLLEMPENVEQFLTTLIKRLAPLAENDLTSLKKYNAGNALALWDVPYCCFLARQDYLTNISNSTFNCITLSAALDGINTVIKSLFNVSLTKVDAEPGELWHSTVDKMILCDENSNALGTIYFDWFDRPNKIGPASLLTIKCGRQLPNGDYQLPIVVLKLRHQKGYSRNLETRITLNELKTLLHEFGHALHIIFGRTRYHYGSGSRCSVDFLEIPSTLMEKTLPYFVCNDKMCTLDPYDAKKLLRSTKMFNAFALLEESVIALFDLRLNKEILPPNVSSYEIFENICREYFPLLNVPGTARHHRFWHLISYGSKYSAYLIAEASADEIWRHCFGNNPLNREAGERWRKVLAYGCERPPAELLELMLNKKPTIDSLANAVIESLNTE